MKSGQRCHLLAFSVLLYWPVAAPALKWVIFNSDWEVSQILATNTSCPFQTEFPAHKKNLLQAPWLKVEWKVEEGGSARRCSEVFLQGGNVLMKSWGCPKWSSFGYETSFFLRSPEGRQYQLLSAQRRHSAPDSYRFQSCKCSPQYGTRRLKGNQHHGNSLLSPRSPGGSHPFGVPNAATGRSTDTSRYVQSATGGAIPGPKVDCLKQQTE